MDFSEATFRYAAAHTTPLPPLLRELERETHLKTLSPQMISGEYQGQLLRLLSLMLRPMQVLEIGTFTGYSTLCLAAGLPDGGLLHTIEVDDELGWISRKYFAKAGLSEKIVQHTGDAAAVVPMLDEQFDFVFLDAGKMNYLEHYEMVLPKMRAGGVLLADNVLWDGKVVRGEREATAEALRLFNAHVHADSRVENLLLPLRDGLLLARKLGE